MFQKKVKHSPDGASGNATRNDRTLLLGLTGSVATRKFPHMINESLLHGFDKIILYPTLGALPFFIETILHRYEDILQTVGLYDQGTSLIGEARGTNMHTRVLLYLRSIESKILGILSSEGQANELLRICQSYEDGDQGVGISSEKKGHIKHIDIARSVDTVLIAPATANTIAKIVNGVTDNFLLEVVRAVKNDGSTPILIAPAMNTEMLQDVFTRENLEKLRKLGPPKYHLLPTTTKLLQCGEYGDGGLLSPTEIFSYIDTSHRSDA